MKAANTSIRAMPAAGRSPPVAVVRRGALRAPVALALGAMASALHAQVPQPAPPAAGTARIALVFGNGDYEVAPLRNPVRDAQLVSRTLREIGFRIALRENGSRQAMLDDLRAWLLEADRSDVRVLYYAGHGVQYRGRSFLLPVDATLETEEDVVRRGIDLGEIVDRLGQTRRGVNVVIVDACRGEPAALLKRTQRRTRSVPQDPLETGLAPTTAPRGTVVVYSTSPGALAADGSPAADGHSVFTRNLTAHLRTPGLPVESLFKQVRMSVMRETGNTQVPWESSSLVGDFCFRPDASGRCAAR